MGAQKIARVEGTAVPVRGDDIDTDRIMPARFLRAVTFERLEQHLFEDERAGSAAGDRAASPHPFDDARYKGASILLVNRNFGCGSSREHAPQGLYRWGIRAVVGESFSGIFFGNALIIGLPCVTASPADVRQLMDRVEKQPDAMLRVDLEGGTCEVEGRAGHRRVGHDRPAARPLRRS
jgi:3-isopropylmalate/(R)-2-methylmalate dehydratase small subunit